MRNIGMAFVFCINSQLHRYNLNYSQLKMSDFAKLKELVTSLEGDAEKFFDKGNGAAGTRLRKGLQEIKILAQEIRNDVTAIKNKGK